VKLAGYLLRRALRSWHRFGTILDKSFVHSFFELLVIIICSVAWSLAPLLEPTSLPTETAYTWSTSISFLYSAAFSLARCSSTQVMMILVSGFVLDLRGPARDRVHTVRFLAFPRARLARAPPRELVCSELASTSLMICGLCILSFGLTRPAQVCADDSRPLTTSSCTAFRAWSWAFLFDAYVVFSPVGKSLHTIVVV